MDRLINSLSKWNIELSDVQINQFQIYFELLIEWNSKMNLTSIVEKKDVIDKHFLDSIALYKFCDINNKSILDVGTGAGFPGIPLKIVCPNTNVVLLDSLAKRITFLNEVISKLELNNINAIHGRAEDFARNIEYREKFDFVVSRAVANLSTLSEYCLPFVRVHGNFVSYKSGIIDDEVLESDKAISVLGGKIDRIEKFIPPYTDFDRSLVFIDKLKNTSKKYPRKAGTPSKEPIKG